MTTSLSDFVRDVRSKMNGPAAPEYLLSEVDGRIKTELREQRELGAAGDDATALAERVNTNHPQLSELGAIRGELKAQIGAEQRQAADNRARITGVGPSTVGEPEFRSIFPSMGEFRSQTVGSDPGGGYMVTGQDSGQFYDRLRPAAVVLQAGPQIVGFDSDEIRLPKLSSSTTVVTAGEGGTLTSSDLALERLTIVARKYAVRTIGSQEWFADSAYQARRILEEDHRKQLAAALDRDFLQGNGSGKLLGLRYWPNVTVTELGAGDGATPSLDNVADALDRLARDNATSSAIFMHPRTWATLRKLKDSQNRYQLQPDPTSDSRRQLFGVPVFISSQISITETEGSSSDCSYIAVVDMARVVVGRRQEVVVLYDPYTRSGTGEVVINTWTRWGFGVLDEEAVEIISGVRA